MVKKKRPREREAGRAPPPPALLVTSAAAKRTPPWAAGRTPESGKYERKGRHRPSMGACELPLPHRLALKRPPPTRQGCTPIAKSAAAKPDARKSNGAFTLAHVMCTWQNTQRAQRTYLLGEQEVG